MIRGLYNSTAGLVAHMARQVTISNNLANVNTTGYKQDKTTMDAFHYKLLGMTFSGTATSPAGALPVGALNTGMGVDQDEIDLSQGSMVETGNVFDLALTGPGFFMLDTPDGIRYTRDGSFLRDAMGQLVTADGVKVLGVDGPIVIGEGEVVVEGDGTITVGGQRAGQLRLVDFAQVADIAKAGQNRFTAVQGAQENPATAVAVNQGFLERSNVDIAQSTIEMMEVLRSYEATQKMVQLQDQVLAATVSQVGTVA